MWIFAVQAVESVIEKLLKPLAKKTPNPIDDIGIDVILGVLKAWLDKKDHPAYQQDTES
jgi:hypothetical protein